MQVRLLQAAITPTEDPPRRTLDYSSTAEERARLAEEHSRYNELEVVRGKRVEDYNEATFGERRPVVSWLRRHFIYLAVVVVVTWFLPRRIQYATLLLAGGVYWLLERRQSE